MRKKRCFIVLASLVFILSFLTPSFVSAATDKTKPTISGANNATAYLYHSFNPRKGVTAKDNVDGNITDLIQISGKVNLKKVGKYTLTYKVTDSAKNTCTVKRVVTVKKDTTKPKITGASNKTVYKGYSFNPKTGVKATDNLDGNLTSKIKVSGTVNTKKVGNYKIKYTVSDITGNKTTVTRTVTVKKDTTKPKITGASNKTVYMGYSFNPKTGVKATDNADGDITSKIKVSGTVNTKKVGNYKIKYTVSDKTGNKTTVTRTITVKKDTTKPKITGASNKTVYMGYSFNPKTGVKATDNLDGNITNKIKISGKVYINEVGTYKLKYSVQDKTKNTTTVTRTIKVVKDTTKPKITGASNKTINYGDSFDSKKGVTATDNVDGTITNKMTISGSVDRYKVGTYTLTYTVKDKTGNKTTITRKVYVVDKVAPTFYGDGLKDKSINMGDTFNPLSKVYATDKVDGDLTKSIKVDGEVNVDKVGIYTLTYTVKDKSGNTAKVERKITVVDNVSPVLEVPEDWTYTYYFDEFDPLEGVKATDNIDGDITAKVKLVEGKVDTTDLEADRWNHLTYSVTDKAGNTAYAYRTVVVTYRDAEYYGVDDFSIILGDSVDLLDGVKVVDKKTKEDITSYVTIESNVEVNKVGTYQVRYYPPEEKGYLPAVGYYTRWVTVRDNVPPVIKGVKDITINSYWDMPNVLEGVTAEDNLDGDITQQIVVEEPEGYNPPKKNGDYVFKIKVTDSSGNVTEESCTVTFKMPPVTNIRVSGDIYDNRAKPGTTFKLWGTVEPYEALQDVVWSSSDESIAKVDKNGNVTTLKEGIVTITAIGDGGVAGELTITVSNKPDLRFEQTSYGGYYADFRLVGYEDGEGVDVEKVQVYDTTGALVKTYSKEDLDNMGAITSISYKQVLEMEIYYVSENFYIGKIVVLTKTKDGEAYEYVLDFDYLFD